MKSFEQCKNALINATLLRYNNPELPLSLCTDASDWAVDREDEKGDPQMEDEKGDPQMEDEKGDYQMEDDEIPQMVDERSTR
ncbi:hypothetical protein AVEN_258516-1 [Araneus ventricosus]|uniref:Reverse transcriptase/retrotransposon-derived protein RNase H-like domain-containing protein n=1 Tax=Araneus ventricosus TaxID=182803 RepID=A0A4Y2XAA6_ARAVE|nr:hypothetical protein AVEN_258516-1 [Araneus ventricosus]